MTDAPKKRGFAAMNPARRREIAAMGGRTAWVNGTAHCFTSKEGREAANKRVHRRGGKQA